MTETGPGSRSIAGLSVLLVEDDDGDALLIRADLVEAGIPDPAIAWRRHLSEALDALPTHPDCVLLDLGLPDADGYRGVHQMVEAAPDAAVIVLTGRQERDGLAALAAGAQDYLGKDAMTAELLERSIRYAVERKRAQRTRQQLREARISAAEQARLERGLLPTPLLHDGRVRCSTYYRPGRDNAVLGGDFFDVVQTEDGRVRAVIGDVMGHGPDEAALGVHLRVAWRALLLAGTPEAAILPALARLLEAEQDAHHRYATVCDLTLDPDAGTATVRVAGHPAPILSAAGASRYAEVAVGPPIGLVGATPGPDPWPATRLTVPPGASLVLYTDGLLEAYTVDRASGGLGIGELVAAVQRHLGGASADTVPAALAALVGSAPHESVDDTAAVVLSVAES